MNLLNHHILFYFQLQQLIVSGELPCTREEASTLAGIQLHLDEAWPCEEDTLPAEEIHEQQEHDRLLKSQDNHIPHISAVVSIAESETTAQSVACW